MAAVVPLVTYTTVLAAEQSAPAAAWSTEGPFFLLEAQTSRLCLSFSLLLSLLGRFLALQRVVGAAVGLLLQQRIISSFPSRVFSCTRTHNSSAAQALNSQNASKWVEGGAAWCGVGKPYTPEMGKSRPSIKTP
jgi:hypothetical protein